MCMLAQSRGGACFCTRDTILGYDVVFSILALAKTVTPEGVPGGSRGGTHRRPLNSPLWPESYRGAEANCIYRPVIASAFLLRPVYKVYL